MLFLLRQKRIEVLEAKERKQGEEERTNHGKANNEGKADISGLRKPVREGWK